MQTIKSDWSLTKEKAIINLLSSSGRCLLSFIRWYTKKQLEKGRNVNKWLQKEVTLLDIKLLCLANFYFIFLHDTLLSLKKKKKKLLLTSVLIAKWIVSLVYFLTLNSSAVDFTEYFKEKKLFNLSCRNNALERKSYCSVSDELKYKKTSTKFILTCNLSLARNNCVLNQVDLAATTAAWAGNRVSSWKWISFVTNTFKRVHHSFIISLTGWWWRWSSSPLSS